MEQTLRVLNELEQTGALGRHAIGGAMGATFYVEPLLTFDLDIFVFLPEIPPEAGECVEIEGVPVQFLPAFNPLLREALAEARETLYEQTPTRVLRAEHLLAIALQTGRNKDRERVRLLNEQAQLDRGYLTSVLQRHGLEARWREWTS